MRNRYVAFLLLLSAGLATGPAGADDAVDPALDLTSRYEPDDGLQAIDLGDIAPIRTDVESFDAVALRSPIVCRRVRTIRSWIPREVCVTREQLARWERSNRERVESDIQTLREIQRFQTRGTRGRWPRGFRY